ncbi:MAG: glycosyl transferase, partial [Lachnospiraceae bacterium]|nr:glycosyl transferase [Lachnospiraceae bacterium]
MILVTLGTQKFQMDRLVQAADKLAETVSEEIFVQSGNSTYVPEHCMSENFVDAQEFQRMIEECSVLITHSGVGTIMRGIGAGKPVVVVPRLAKYHEHVDDHQVQIAEAFASKGCVLYCTDLTELAETVQKARTYSFLPYHAPKSNVED